ncbi:hypothetical protein [Rhodopirellula halodulae]|uniref:hypothetical protein n=1 Tax=Rhodopirellula halodulae TaxID=2894198 RepID=UPI001E2B8685|nr:hypothetical protein [Rhodopirellula sp. JC737]MCC9658892.1 hypothetical protein [Rhodopirellula sp. JC737]
MKKLLSSAAILSFVASGSIASAQGVLNNTASQVGNAVRGTAGQVQNAARNTVGSLRNRVDDAAASSSPQSHGPTGQLNDGEYYAAPGTTYGQSTIGNRVYSDLQTVTPTDYQYDGNSQHVNHSGHHGQVSYHAVPMQTHYGAHVGNHANAVYTLRHDSNGREFICVAGQRVYFDNSTSNDMQQNGAEQNGTEQSGTEQSDWKSAEGQANNEMQDERYEAAYGNQDNDSTNSDDLENREEQMRETLSESDEASADVQTQNNVDADLENDVAGVQADANADTNLDAGLTPDENSTRTRTNANADTELDSNINGDNATTNVNAGLDAAVEDSSNAAAKAAADAAGSIE